MCVLRLPGVVFEELARVEVAFRGALCLCTGDERHREEARGLGIKHGLKAINEGDEFAIHLAVDDRAADDYGVVFIPINAFTVSFDDAHQIGLMTFSDDGFPNAAGNAGGMAAMAVVKDKNGLHECLLRTLRRSSGARFPSRR